MNDADAWQAHSRGILLRAAAVADASAAGVSGPRFEAGDLRLRLPTELRPLSRPSCRKRGESVSVSRQLLHSSWREKSCTCLLSGPQNQASATVAVWKLLQGNGQGLVARQACAAAAARVDALRLLQVDGRKRRHRWIGKLFPIEGSALKAAA